MKEITKLKVENKLKQDDLNHKREMCEARDLSNLS